MSDLCDQRMQNLIEGGLYQMNEFEEKIEQLDAKIKDQEATIDALLNQNKTQMEELEKLEAWQKEAVKHLKKYKRKCDFLMEEIDILALIKQAEDNGK